MPKFTTGLVVGVGIAVLFAPLSGQEMRQLIADRAQKLRASATPAPKHLQAPSPPAHTGQPAQTDDLKNLPEAQPIDEAASEPASSSGIAEGAQMGNVTPTEAIPEPAATDTQSQGVGMHDANTQDEERTVALPSPIKYSMHAVSNNRDDLDSIPGMTPELRQTFERAGITTQQQLLQRTPSKEAASDLAHTIGTSVRTMRHTVTCADLLRLPGADSDTVSLLEQAGVTSCQDLQQRNPEHLHAKLVEIQAQQSTAMRVPSLDQLSAMISAASNLAATGKA